MKAQIIQDRIYEVRREKIMLDFDLAQLYSVETRVFNQAVKRNAGSFPRDFMFKLTVKEWKEILLSQVVNIEPKGRSSQNVMTSMKYRSAKYLPYAFTEHGVYHDCQYFKKSESKKDEYCYRKSFYSNKKICQ